MGKGGKRREKAQAEVVDDDALLEAAMAENLRLRENKAATSKTTAEATKPSSPLEPGCALSQEAIVRKLNAVPTFCILNGDRNMVGMESEEGGETMVWFIEAAEAKAWLEAAVAANPDLGLHLGVVPLGIAFSFCVGWTPSHFIGGLKIQGNSTVVNDVRPMLLQQLEAQGMDPGMWQLPLFCCDELQGESALPVFTSRTTLVEAWVASGRTRETVPDCSVLDLRLLVQQMQTDIFAWHTVQFVAASAAVEAVREAKAKAKVATKDEPPPLEGASDPADEPPPLEGGINWQLVNSSESAPPLECGDGSGEALPSVAE